uniref:Uncharacterized protein n=44 Tax=Kayfunavirus TaxID=2732686 RepID=A0A7D5G3X0_9CAUD
MSEYLRVLAALKSCPKTFQSNYVRNNAALVAEAASRGHLSCLSMDGRNNGAWEITAAGTKFLNQHGGCLSEYLRVLAALKSCPKTFQSNYVRNNAALVAEAASRGHLSCLSMDGRNNGAWEITAAGTKFLNQHGGCLWLR